MFISMFGFIGIIVSIKTIDNLTKEYQRLLNLLEKEK
jgi:hypothetical protein